jgi:exodeoxyribonuclease V beta subunit
MDDNGQQRTIVDLSNMKTFNVLDKDLDIHQNYLLEASAGTGKTFSIENLVVRLLLERERCSINEILIVTFTREATRELKSRIRNNISKALSFLLGRTEEAPEYLYAHREDDQARRSLEQALACFDESQIFTIHGFCQQILQENALEMNENSILGGELLKPQEVKEVIRDFFRTELHSDRYCSEQLKLVLKKYQNRVSELEEAIFRHLMKGTPIKRGPTFKELFDRFQKEMNRLIQMGLNSEIIMDDFYKLAPHYKEICNRSKEIKPEILAAVERFSSLFNKTSWLPQDLELLFQDQLILLQKFKPEKLKIKAIVPSAEALRFPNLISLLKENIEPLILEGRSQIKILANMSADCHQMLQTFLMEEEKFRYDDLLKSVAEGIKNHHFAQRIRNKYKAVIIDEFQDTDQIQWNIFSGLFLENNLFKGSVYLVGDPKQSIYGFRQADIYTYMQATKAFKEENIASLTTNYRSQKSLIDALNTLFGATKGLFHLPKIGSVIDYHHVASGLNKEKHFADSLGAIHFCVAKGDQAKSNHWPSIEMEENYLFPFLAEEIKRLYSQDAISFEQWAVLVRDRFQAERLSLYLKKCNIPTITQRQKSLADSSALQSLIELLESAMDPSNTSALKIALGGQLIGWNHEMIKKLSEPFHIAPVHAIFEKLHQTLVNEGFARFFYEFLRTSWHYGSQNVFKRLILQEGGVDLYNELHQIAEILMEEQNLKSLTPKGLLTFLQNFQEWSLQEEERGKVKQDSGISAVKILTLHMSKGLEFDIVFALGLANRTPRRSDLISVTTENQSLLVPLRDDDECSISQAYHEEIDAEKMRQLYVAMTRAKYRLYLPLLGGDGRSLRILPGEASPMELFLSHLNNSEDKYSFIQKGEFQSFLQWIEDIGKNHSITYSEMIFQESIQPLFDTSKNEPSLLLKTVEVPGKSHFIFSFSTLNMQSQEKSFKKQEETPHNFQASIKNAHTLPTGSETGIILHRILEKIPFPLVQNAVHSQEILPFIEPFIIDTPYQEWGLVIADIIFNALKTPIYINNTSFCLCDVPEDKCYRELEFLYPQREDGVVKKDDFIKGVIDLIIQVEGKYYLIDWKTNWLGPSIENYQFHDLEQTMKEDGYHLQASLYSEAWKRYLRIIENRDESEYLGGNIYLFLRGLKANSSTGIYLS